MGTKHNLCLFISQADNLLDTDCIKGNSGSHAQEQMTPDNATSCVSVLIITKHGICPDYIINKDHMF